MRSIQDAGAKDPKGCGRQGGGRNQRREGRSAAVESDPGGHTRAFFNQILSYCDSFQPGRGNFVVRVSGVDEPVVELLAMKRPFPPLKALDMDEISEKVLKAIEGQS